MIAGLERLAVIIVNYRTPELAIACMNSLVAARSSFELEVIVVDGGSGDGSAEMIAQEIAARGHRDWIELLPLSINGGFAFANNRALMALAERRGLPNLIALINPDARVMPGALEELASTLNQRQQAGAVGAQLVHEDGRTQGSAFRFPSLRGEFCRGARTGFIDRILGQQPLPVDSSEACEVPWVTGAAVMIRATALQSVGFFDEGFFLYFEETELMWRLRQAGWTIWHQPAAHIFHAGGAATKIRDPETGLPLRKRMPRYWYESRRRYFALVGSRSYAFAAGLAWLAGYSLWTIRRFLSRTQDGGTLRPVADLIAYGWWPGSVDARAAIPVSASPAPAWMSART
ncbi:MAG: family 2 glycosyl transferase [Bradyrhizobium sp.]|nr:family 2 glycosyl transferase [Bradyrhizobium sp.]